MVFIPSLSRQLRRPATHFLSAGPLKPVTTGSVIRAPLTGAFSNARTLTASANLQGKVLLVLYDVSDLNRVVIDSIADIITGW